MTEHGKEYDSIPVEPNAAAVPRMPLETYCISKTRPALETVRQISTKPLRQAVWKTLLLFAAAALLTSLVNRENSASWLAFYIGASLVYCSTQWGILHNHKKRWEDDVKRAEASEYLTEIFEDGYRLTVTRDGQETLRYFTAWEDVQGAWRTPEYLILYDRTVIHYLPVSELPADSRLYTALSDKLMPKKGQKKHSRANGEEQALPSRWQRLSKLFAVLTALALVASLVILPMMLWMPHGISLPSYTLLLSIPVLCLVFDGIWNRGGKNRKSNRTLCITAIVIIAVVAVGVFLLSDALDHGFRKEDPTPAYELAQTADVDLPPDLDMVYSIETPEPTDLTTPTRIYYLGMLDLEDEAESFAEKVKNDPRWLSPLPTELRGLLPDIAATNVGIPDYVLFYRIGEQTYNELPEGKGSYRYLCFIYHEISGTLEVYHYDLLRAVATTP